MSTQLSELLGHWYPHRDDCDWVLGTVYRTEGPSYRKAGAMMLFNSLGQQFGMLSGGCLESDIQTHARRVMQTGDSVTLCYDGSDEDDLSFQLGIGCGGVVWIVLHPVTAENHYLQLDQVYDALRQRRSGQYRQLVPEHVFAPAAADFTAVKFSTEASHLPQTGLQQRHGQLWLDTLITPPPHILVVGGGIDARPVVSMAKQMGWEVSLWDPRPANARREFFMAADHILSEPAEALHKAVHNLRIDTAVIMSHNIDLDAATLKSLNGSGLQFIALLGPIHRKQQVLNRAGLNIGQLQQPLSGPAGLDIGGELPESIALSILAECHKELHLAAQPSDHEMAREKVA